MPAKLTATSYALLGLLRLQPWSAYELTKYMQTTAVSFIWPRAKAGIYTEPRKLVAHRLATARVESKAGRSRTIYEITDEGRRALAAWLARPDGKWSFASETALQVFFADGAGRAELRNALRALADDVRARYPEIEALLARWLDQGPRFPQRLHCTAMMADLIRSVSVAVDDWATRWLTLSAAWPDAQLNDANAAQIRKILEQLHAEIHERASRPAP